MNKLVFRQGDAVAYPFPIYYNNILIREIDIDDIEISIGTFLQKSYKNGNIKFDKQQNYFILYLTQEDTFSLLPSRYPRNNSYFEYPTQIRVKLRNYQTQQNQIFSFQGPNVEVLESLSKERL